MPHKLVVINTEYWLDTLKYSYSAQLRPTVQSLVKKGKLTDFILRPTNMTVAKCSLSQIDPATFMRKDIADWDPPSI